MKRSTKYLRRIVISAIGFPLFILGIILVPLPGPGLLTMLAALFILSLEFDWAKKHFERVKSELKKIIDKAKAKQAELEKKSRE